jgi:recombinational DNA repair protein RecR
MARLVRRMVLALGYLAYCSRCGRFTEHTDAPMCTECGG